MEWRGGWIGVGCVYLQVAHFCMPVLRCEYQALKTSCSMSALALPPSLPLSRENRARKDSVLQVMKHERADRLHKQNVRASETQEQTMKSKINCVNQV